MSSAAERREQLNELSEACHGCPHAGGVVSCTGDVDASLMFVGVAPSAVDEERGIPFAGQAGALLDRLLASIGLARQDVFVANLVGCRPPGNRDPLPREVEACRELLHRRLELVRPRVVCSLGNFATRTLREDTTPITRLHGHEELRRIGSRVVCLYPLIHPSAALYTPPLLASLRTDFARIPELLALPEPEQPAFMPEEPVLVPDEPGEQQLGLF